jgi:hypothetical protein
MPPDFTQQAAPVADVGIGVPELWPWYQQS